MGESETSNLNNKGNRGDNATLAWIHKNCPGGGVVQWIMMLMDNDASARGGGGAWDPRSPFRSTYASNFSTHVQF